MNHQFKLLYLARIRPDNRLGNSPATRKMIKAAFAGAR